MKREVFAALVAVKPSDKELAYAATKTTHKGTDPDDYRPECPLNQGAFFYDIIE